MLRESITFLKENEKKWQHRKIQEVERIRIEERSERLAICTQKKKRYGIKQLNKEENRRIKERTEERILVSQAKANYWKMHRGKETGYKELYKEHWSKLKDGILALEEEGSWVSMEDSLKNDCNDGGVKEVEQGGHDDGIHVRDLHDGHGDRADARKE